MSRASDHTGKNQGNAPGKGSDKNQSGGQTPPPPGRRRTIALFAALAAGAALLLVAVSMLLPGTPTSSVATQANVGGPFRLVDQNGVTVTEESLRGKPTLVFFGFTHCPDVCPTALFEISEVFTALGPDADKAQAFFISVDPERDTPEAMKSYLGSFAPQLRGLTGSPQDIEAVKKAYRVYSRKVPLQDGDYTMDHTALIYLMDKTGAFATPFDTRRAPEEAAAELKRYF